jgi:hypothetical protein
MANATDTLWSTCALLLVAAVLALPLPALGADALTPEEAAGHIGDQAEVCGVVASAKFATESRGQPTFLNLGRPYPSHVFTALIWGSDRGKFTYALETLESERICVRGVISDYRGKAQIIVSRPSQIQRAGD